MPTYIYQCQESEGHGEFEAFQSIKDPPVKICPKCIEEGKLEGKCLSPKKLIAATSFILKGGGWANSGYS